MNPEWSTSLPTKAGLYLAIRYDRVFAVVVRQYASAVECDFPQGVTWRTDDPTMPKGYEWYGPVKLPPPFELSGVEDEQ